MKTVTVWKALRETVLPADLLTGVKRVKRVARNGSVLFRISVNPAKFPETLSRMQMSGRRLGWKVTEDKPHPVGGTGRQARVNPKKNDDPNPNSSGKLCTWNVCSVRGKRVELRHFLGCVKPACLAIQETHLRPEDWYLALPGYQFLHTPATPHEPGMNGVGLAIRKDVIAYEYGEINPFLKMAKVMLQGAGEPWIIGSVYIPPSGYAARRTAIESVRRTLERMLFQNPQRRVVFMGDWNIQLPALKRRIARWHLPLCVLPIAGSCKTRYSKREGAQWTALDHMVVSLGAAEQMRKGNVLRSWDLSDHWPVTASVKPFQTNERKLKEGAPPPKKAMWLDPKRCREKREAILLSNRWEVLADMTDDTPDTLVEAFVRTTYEVGREAGLVSEKQLPGQGSKMRDFHRLPRTLAAESKAKGALFRAWQKARGRANEATTRQEYEEARKTFRKNLKTWRDEQWAAHVAKGSSHLTEQRPKEAWRWLKGILGKNRGSSGRSSLQPVKDSKGELQLEPAGIRQVWTDHYQNLGRDVTGHSRDQAHWRSLSHSTRSSSGGAPEIGALNDDLSWVELRKAIQALRPGKAPGKDGIPGEWYRLLVEDEEGSSAMARALLRVMVVIWKAGVIPETWATANIVTIPKSGDPTDPNNYRGISLIDIGLKLLSKVIIERITREAEGRDWMRPEQAGFRKKEECVGQFVALLETLQRRRLKGEDTYVAFIDMKKAYDTVPQEALLWKLETLGVKGRCLKFLRALYQSSKAEVLVGGPPASEDDCSSTTTSSFQLERGVRQGCPMSPVLFNLFANDILNGCERYGVVVPGIGPPVERLPGLMFADDIVLLASTPIHLQKQLKRIGRWAERWEMSFGTQKCGVMKVQRDPSVLQQIVPPVGGWRLHGEDIPVVNQYKYLGMVLSHDLDINVIVDDRLAKTKRSLEAAGPFLKSQSIPTMARVMAVKAMILPVATFGGEVVGMNQAGVSKLQRQMDKAVRWIAGAGVRSRVTASATLWKELGIPPVAAVTASLRARALVKFGGLRTWVSRLTNHPMTHRKRTWVTNGLAWMRRYKLPIENTNRVKREVKRMVWKRMEGRVRPVSLALYDARGYEKSREYVKRALRHPSLSRGVSWLLRLRVQAVWTARKAVQAGLIPEGWRNSCPSCGVEIPREEDETTHVLLHCRKFSEVRSETIARILRRVEGFSLTGDRASQDNVVFLLGGRLGGQSLMPMWLGTESQDAGEMGLPEFAQVAKFLQYAMPLHMKMLWRLADRPRASS